MTNSLTYPPEIVIEITVELPPEPEPPSGERKQISAEFYFEPVLWAIELVAHLLDHT